MNEMLGAGLFFKCLFFFNVSMILDTNSKEHFRGDCATRVELYVTVLRYNHMLVTYC